MRKKRLIQLAEWLEAGAPHERIEFDMSTGITTVLRKKYDPKAPEQNVCATSCCIAGAATQFFATKKSLKELMFGDNVEWDSAHVAKTNWRPVRRAAMDLLGLDETQADRLFTPDAFWYGYLSEYSDPQWAARTIRNLLKTGVVDWQESAVYDKKNADSRQSYLASQRDFD